MDFRTYIFLVAAVLCYSESCKLTFDSNECQYNMHCIKVIDDYQGWQRFRNDYRPLDVACSRKLLITYSGYTLDPVNLVMKDADTSRPVPIVNQYGRGTQGAVEVIYSLDLSENKYENTPVIKSMQNLVKLNLSRNELTTAVLSNLNELNKLSEIDLSYNKISDIEVKSSEHPYSMLTKINISKNYLVTIPDAAFDKCDNLQILDLSYNVIEGLGPLTFEGVKNLLNLNISNNELTDINSSLFRFSELKVLSLSNNKINNLRIIDFEKLNKLEHLDLSSNSIKTINDNVFENMVRLKSLDLSNNLLESLSKEMLSNSQSLSSIDLSANKFKSLPKGLFKNKTVYIFSITDNLLEGSLVKGMFEGINETILDLSKQLLTAIEDYAFYDLIRLDTLLLNDNGIQLLSNMSFKALKNLKVLDLSNNQISSLDFNKEDLTNLQTLMIKNNKLSQIKQENFQDLNSLKFLDLSDNAITRLEPSSFNSLRSLLNLHMSNNPLSGTLETDTFEGLILLPSLDISCNLLTTVQNGSFNNMNTLKELNMSRSKIKEVQYNTFIDTGSIVKLDLSYNKLESFFINTTDLVRLSILLLNNNQLKTIPAAALHGLSELSKISLANNFLENLDNKSFIHLINLRFLDLSNNAKFNFNVVLLNQTKTLGTLVLSGVKTNINFANLKNSSISDVVITEASLYNISMLNLRSTHVKTLVLSNNNVSNIETDAFSGIGTLIDLDLSYNKISFIQPGSFKDNVLLVSLNISYNSLSVIGYGVLRGLYSLKTLDVSYNNIKDLQTERFYYEVQSLSELIVDHNKIDSVNAEEFGKSLSKLSIGDNPLPCHVLVRIKAKKLSLKITAIKLDEQNGENVDGVRCNKERILEPQLNTDAVSENKDIFVDIRNILYKISNKDTVEDSNSLKYLENVTKLLETSNYFNNEKQSSVANLTSSILQNMTNVIETSNSINTEKISLVANLTSSVLQNLTNIIETSNSINNEKLSRVIELNNDTNMLFKLMIKSLDQNFVLKTPSGPSSGNTSTSIIGLKNTLDPIPYINKIKTDLERTIADEKQNIMNELETKYSLIYKIHQKESLSTSLSNETFVSHEEGTHSLFTETCIGLILLILVGFVAYNVYKSRLFLRNRSSISTRNTMDDSTL